MSQKQGPDIHGSYMDGVRVKISEQYKPPPKISLAVSYPQRIALNKQLEDNMPQYDFTLETSIKEKMRDWRNARNLINLDRKEKLDKIKEEYWKSIEEKNKEDEKIEEAKRLAMVNENESKGNYASGGVLIPTQVNANNYTNILTPTPLLKQPSTCKTTDKSPINISDFETDNSSPFDNMELKTINDLEELKIVLQNEDKNFVQNPNYTHPQTYDKYPASHNQSSYYGYNIPHSSNQLYSGNTLYANGYSYYQENSVPSSYNVYNATKNEYSQSFETQMPSDASKIPFRSVPDIMNALQTELNNSHVDNKTTLPSHSTKNTDASPRDNLKMIDEENPYENLPKNLQDVCDVINSMGFPLPRVARVAKIVGADQKKIVEHLLAMSELLDLGFSEPKVSSALLKCNNDRDKALELLIS